MNTSLSPRFSKLEVMNFLNEVSMDYPNAVSFAAGRPAAEFFKLQDWVNLLPVFVEHFARKEDISTEQAYGRIGQYGRTNGFINDLIAEQLHNDENMSCTAEQVIVTAGCQEAMALCITTLLSPPQDVLLVFDPSYIGITGLAEIHGITVMPIVQKQEHSMLEALAGAVRQVEAAHKRPKVLYLVADFSNPTGQVISREDRLALIEFCAERQIYILEDNAYGMFRFEGDKQPTLYSLDNHGCVLYLGTYSKYLCPSVRIGFMVLPASSGQNLNTRNRDLKQRLSEAKGFSTANTSQLAQAIVGAVLLNEGKTLSRLVSGSLQHYKSNLQLTLQALATVRAPISWNTPTGGFFIAITLPFRFGASEMRTCAQQYNLLCMPMSFFAYAEDFDFQVRFAFSGIAKEDIGYGVAQFSQFIDAMID